jgi:hypothetical protein
MSKVRVVHVFGNCMYEYAVGCMVGWVFVEGTGTLYGDATLGFTLNSVYTFTIVQSWLVVYYVFPIFIGCTMERESH